MKKILISSALFAVLLAGCGTDTAEVKETEKNVTQQEKTTNAAKPTEEQEVVEQEVVEQEVAEQEVTEQQTSQQEPQQQEQKQQQEPATEVTEVETAKPTATEEADTNKDAETEQVESTEQTEASDEATSNTETNEQEAQQEQVAPKQLTLYTSDEDANYIEPYEATFTGTDEEIVRFIFEKVATFDTNLNSYKFENNGSTLVLDLDDTIFNVQGSAGGALYAGTLAQSYFDNLPNVNEVTFTYNGSYEEILDHLSVGVPYKRGEISVIAP